MRERRQTERQQTTDKTTEWGDVWPNVAIDKLRAGI